MRRRMVNLAVAVSLTFFMATVTLWVLSYWRSDCLIWFTPWERSWRTTVLPSYVELSSSPAIGRRTGFLTSSERAPASVESYYQQYGPYADTYRGIGFGVLRNSYTPWHSVVVPLWFLAAVTALSTLCCYRLRGFRGTVRCRRCGYDLRATPDRCPECGMVVKVGGAAAG